MTSTKTVTVTRQHSTDKPSKTLKKYSRPKKWRSSCRSLPCTVFGRREVVLVLNIATAIPLIRTYPVHLLMFLKNV